MTPATLAEGLSEVGKDALVNGYCASDSHPDSACICAFDYDELIDAGLAEVRTPDIGPRGIFRTDLGLSVRAYLKEQGK